MLCLLVYNVYLSQNQLQSFIFFEGGGGEKNAKIVGIAFYETLPLKYIFVKTLTISLKKKLIMKLVSNDKC